MLSFLDPTASLSRHPTRREWLRLGGLSALGLTLSGLTRAADYAGERPPARARSCILVFISGARANTRWSSLCVTRCESPTPPR